MSWLFHFSFLKLLLTTLFLATVTSSHNSSTVGSEERIDCKGLSDESGIMSLDCSDQGLISVPEISPGKLVQTLDLSYNTLHRLHKKSFNPYPNLKELILSYASISNIHVNTFSGLTALKKLDLSHNDLKFIHSNSFTLNTNLETLSLQGNPLQLWPTGAPLLFSTSLLSLDLSYCRIAQLSSESFSGLHQLRSLDLSYNRLPRVFFDSMIHLSSIRLAGNPWQCGCDFHFLLTWISSSHNMDSDIGNVNNVECQRGDQLIIQENLDDICKNITDNTHNETYSSTSVESTKKDHLLDKVLHNNSGNYNVNISVAKTPYLKNDDDDFHVNDTVVYINNPPRTTNANLYVIHPSSVTEFSNLNLQSNSSYDREDSTNGHEFDYSSYETLERNESISDSAVVLNISQYENIFVDIENTSSQTSDTKFEPSDYVPSSSEKYNDNNRTLITNITNDNNREKIISDLNTNKTNDNADILGKFSENDSEYDIYDDYEYEIESPNNYDYEAYVWDYKDPEETSSEYKNSITDEIDKNITKDFAFLLEDVDSEGSDLGMVPTTALPEEPGVQISYEEYQEYDGDYYYDDFNHLNNFQSEKYETSPSPTQFQNIYDENFYETDLYDKNDFVPDLYNENIFDTDLSNENYIENTEDSTDSIFNDEYSQFDDKKENASSIENDKVWNLKNIINYVNMKTTVIFLTIATILIVIAFVVILGFQCVILRRFTQNNRQQIKKTVSSEPLLQENV